MMFIMWFSGKLKLRILRTRKNVLSLSLCGLLKEELVFRWLSKTQLNICTILKPKGKEMFSFPFVLEPHESFSAWRLLVSLGPTASQFEQQCLKCTDLFWGGSHVVDNEHARGWQSPF